MTRCPDYSLNDVSTLWMKGQNLVLHIVEPLGGSTKYRVDL